MLCLDVISEMKPDDITTEMIIGKLSNKIPHLAPYVCGLQATEEALATPEGVDLIGKTIDMIGE